MKERRGQSESSQRQLMASLKSYAFSVMSAAFAETATYPLDITKTRLQIQGSRQAGFAGMKRGLLRTGWLIVREEGLLRLWSGVTPAICRHVVYSGCRIVFYERIRKDVFGHEKTGHFPLWKAILSGMSAGAAAQFLASPTDLIKVRMQAEGRALLELQSAGAAKSLPRKSSAWQIVADQLRRSGIRGLWAGWAPNVQRAALVNLGDLTTYDSAKSRILRYTPLSDNMVTHFLASCCSGLVAATFGTPADVIKTRYMGQPLDERGKGKLYRSTIDCLGQALRREGFWALYKGFVPTWLRMAPWSLLFWLSNEQLRRLGGSTSF